ncbi:MAG TPA: phosphoglucomutase (alpha-D-glucose-1,6-bisphosphate-dependent) [Trueperaceae bacterium]|nr:phosphoglucomutase (alpha-D-glucose-1,6-bisphosphate-dependent) [Trueperaceae bacterium]
MSTHPLAGRPAPSSSLIDVPRLVTSYYVLTPDAGGAGPDAQLAGPQSVAFGTSGHRGTSVETTFNEAHVAAICQAVVDFRTSRGIAGPLFLGADTHALSEPAMTTAIEVLAANGVSVVVADRADAGWGDAGGSYGRRHLPVPTPVISHAILKHNAGEAYRTWLAGSAAAGASYRSTGHDVADGIVATPSHNPPGDGGFKYNPPHGGPAGSTETSEVQRGANAYLAADLAGVKRIGLRRALVSGNVEVRDLVTPYVEDLGAVVDMDAIRASGLRIGAAPLGGAALPYLLPIADRWGIDLTVVDDTVDPTFAFMPLDHDGVIRMDCSSEHAMANLVALRDRYDVAFGNDPDADRHGIVTRSGGLMNPNHYLAVAVQYLFGHRPGWPAAAAIGKTLVSSSMIDKVAGSLGRRLVEVPVGFKWFVTGLLSGELGFGGEESAGAAFLRRDGKVWTTDKDGVIMGLLAAEVMAVTGSQPSELYGELTRRFGEPHYARLDVPATVAQKSALQRLSSSDVVTTTLAGEAIEAVLSHAPGNGAAVGGIKVVTASGWFAARPSGTENIYKIYAESFTGSEHLARLQEEAKALVGKAFESSGSVAGEVEA